MTIVIDVLKRIGTRGLAFRASKEAAYSLKNDTINHGNFLQIILLNSKYDTRLEKHLKKAIEKVIWACPRGQERNQTWKM